MANLTIKTSLTNVSDSDSVVSSVSLDGVPFSTFTAITSRVFTVNSGNVFSVKPYIVWNVSDKSAYNVVKSETSTATTFTINYTRPLSPPTTDVITFFSTATTSSIATGTGINSVVINSSNIKSIGETRVLTVNGDPGARFTLDVLTQPKIGPLTNQATMIIGPLTCVIGVNGSFQKGISFPPTTELTGYKVLLTEIVPGSFSNNLSSPNEIFIDQYPQHQVELVINDGGLSTARTPSTLYFSGEYNSRTLTQAVFTAVKSSDDLFAGQTDTTDGAFSGTNMQMDTSYVTKKVAVGDVISHANLVTGTHILAVNVGGVADTYTISDAPTAEIADNQTINFDTFTIYQNDATDHAYSDFTQTTGQSQVVKGNSALDTTEKSPIFLSNPTITIDNSGTDASAVVTFDVEVTHKYDGHSGHTRLVLDVNTILRV